MSDEKRAEFYDVVLEDNYTFDSVNVLYRLQTPNQPDRRLNFNMGTKKAQLQFTPYFINLDNSKLREYHAEKIQVRMRDGFELPLVLKYDRRFYNEDSPWVLFTSGIKSSKGGTAERMSYISNTL